MATKDITILMSDEIHDMIARPVEAEVIGPFGFHESISAQIFADDYRYTITHVPTGYAILYARTKANARKIIKALNKLHDWRDYEPGDDAPEGYWSLLLDLIQREIMPQPGLEHWKKITRKAEREQQRQGP